MKKALLTASALAIVLHGTLLAAVSDKLKSRIDESATILSEIHAAPDKDVPKEL